MFKIVIIVISHHKLSLPPSVSLSLTLSLSLGMAILHYAEVSLPAPPRYPDLYPALFSLFGAMNLFVMYCIGIIWQMNTQ